jgi:predicted dienelactone hydrolase
MRRQQRTLRPVAIVIVSLFWSVAAHAAYTVQTFEVTWHDDARHRTIAAKIYAPKDAPGLAPVIIFSHGLGNSREGYSYLGEQWASQGYVSIHPEHPGADVEVTKHGLWHLYRAGFDRTNWETIPRDISFVIDQVVRGNLPEPLRGRVDVTHIGVSGHSIGAYAALAIGGMNGVFRDERVRAAIPMSMSEEMPPDAYKSVAIPMLHLTGTHDSSLLYGTTPADRRVPFESIPRDDQFLINIKGANHSTFSDDESAANRAMHDIIRTSTTLFWNAYLRGDARSLAALKTMAEQKLRVGTVTVNAGSLFNKAESARGGFYRGADFLHTQTPERLLRSFLLFREGEPFDETRLRESERNLRALDFVKSASITESAPHDGVVDVTVTTEDEFTTDANVDFSNGGGRSLYDLDLTQKDLLGTGAEADMRIANGRERRTRSLELLDPALFGAYTNGDLLFARSSDGGEEKLAVERPLASYTTPSTYSVSFDHLKQDSRVYELGSVAALFRERHRELAASYGGVLAATSDFAVRLLGGIDFLSDEFTPRFGIAPDNRNFRFFESGIDSQQFDFIKLDHVDLGMREQDFNLGMHVSLFAGVTPSRTIRYRSDDSYGHAFSPSAFVLTRLTATTREHAEHRNTIVSADTRLVDRWQTALPATSVARFRVDYGSDVDRDVQFFADGQNGLRAYPNFAFSGSRRIVFNAEHRIFLGREWLQLFEPGAAVFADSGVATNDRRLLHNWKTDAGLGFRFGVARFESTMLRLDLAWAFNDSPLSRRGLVFSFATSQAF